MFGKIFIIKRKYFNYETLNYLKSKELIENY